MEIQELTFFGESPSTSVLFPEFLEFEDGKPHSPMFSCIFMYFSRVSRLCCLRKHVAGAKKVFGVKESRNNEKTVMVVTA